MKKLIVFAFIAGIIAVSAGCAANGGCFNPFRRPTYTTLYSNCVDDCFTGCPTSCAPACPTSECGSCTSSNFGGTRFEPGPAF